MPPSRSTPCTSVPVGTVSVPGGEGGDKSSVTAALAAKNERIMERRKRIEARRVSKGMGLSTTGVSDTNKITSSSVSSSSTSIGPGKRSVNKAKEYKEAQIVTEESNKNIDAKMSELIDEGKRISAQSRKTITEFETRDTREMDERRMLIKKELDESSVNRDAFNIKWAAVSNDNNPEELAADIIQLHDWCMGTLDRKDKVIKELFDKLKERDDEYISMIRQHRAEIDDFFLTMRRSIIQLRQEKEKELKKIEESFMDSRTKILKLYASEIDTLINERSAREASLMEQRLNKIEEYEKKLEKNMNEGIDRYVREKERLENEANIREQQMEKIRAVYQLNTQKLDYNYTALVERDMEANHTIAQQKRKIARLQDALSGVISRYTKAESKHRAVNKELTQAYKRLIEQYNELQTKYKHFERAAGVEYKKLWAHYEEVVGKKLDSVVTADKIISENLLGLQPVCNPPEAKPVEEVVESLENESSTLDILEQCEVGKERAEEIIMQLSSAVPLLSRESLLSALNHVGEEENDSVNANTNNTNTVTTTRALLTLGVTKSSQLDLLFQQLINPNNGEMYPRERLLATLRNFVAGVKDSTDSINKTTQLKAKNTDLGDLKFWKKIADSMPQYRLRTWELLMKSLEKYSDVLRERARLVETNDGVAQQNRELRQLLAQYLRSGSSNTLLHPPVMIEQK